MNIYIACSRSAMEDIEDAVPGGFPPGLRLPTTGVRLKPRKSRLRSAGELPASINGVPGTQTIYLKTFGCSHNQSDSEYMAGQLSAYGYMVNDNPEQADLWLINTCTVKSPSQSAMETLIHKGRTAGKPLVVAGCVPQGSRDLKDLNGISIIGVQQIDRVVEVVEETLKGHEVRLLQRSTLPALDLPKVRRNKFVEILPINVGCLGACTYCKTKHARGHLGSYPVATLVERVKAVIAEGVKEIWLSSEDTGAYGRDIGVNLPILLKALVAELPPDRSTMLRIGMTNPPFILEHLEEIAKILCHPCVYSFLHVPVQSGSDSVLNAMNREYTASEFKLVVDTLKRLVPDMQIATDVICGFPGETSEDFEATITLIKEYKFPQVHISQFYPRPGTPAARMKRVPTAEVKKRSRELTTVFESFTPYAGMEGQIERVWITDAAADGIHLVGHTKSYVQVLVIAPDSFLGISADVKITSVGRWSVFGDIVGTPHEIFAACNSFVPKDIEESAIPNDLNEESICPSEFDAGTHSVDKKFKDPSVVGDCETVKIAGTIVNANCQNCTCSVESDLERKHIMATKDECLKSSLGTACAVSTGEKTLSYYGNTNFIKRSVSSLVFRKKNDFRDTKEDKDSPEIQWKDDQCSVSNGFSILDWVLLGGMVLSFSTILLLLQLVL